VKIEIKKRITYIYLFSLLLLTCDFSGRQENNFKINFNTKIRGDYIEITANGTYKNTSYEDEIFLKDLCEETILTAAIEELSKTIITIIQKEYPVLGSGNTRVAEVLNTKIRNNLDKIKIINKSVKHLSQDVWESLIILRYLFRITPIESFILKEAELIRKSTGIEDISENRYYTGLIIDLTGFKKAPPISQSFQIYSNDGRYVFGLENLKKDIFLQGEGIHYTSHIFSAKEMITVIGHNPYIIDFNSIIGIVRDKIIISEQAADLIIQNNIINGFLEKGKIILII